MPLHHPALEAEVLAAVAQPGVLEGLGIGVDAEHRRGGAREHLRAVTLAARHVDDARPEDARADPLVDGKVAPVPVILGRNVGQRPLSGQPQRRHTGRLIALQMSVHGHADRVMSPPP